MTLKQIARRCFALILGTALAVGSIGYTGLIRYARGQNTAGTAADAGDKVEKGRALVGEVCTQCHSLSPILMQKRGSEEWKNTVYSMISRGAQILPEEIEPVAAYLSANFGPNSRTYASGRSSARNETTAAGGSQEKLPDGPGKAVLSGVCTQCHDLAPVAGARKSEAEWGDTLDRMRSFGASLTAGEQRQLLEYLTKNFGSAR